MLQERFRDLLEIMATFLEHQGYKQSRKKGEFHRPVSGKIIKLRMVLSSRMRGGRVGEIRIFLALEYPELEKIVSLLKETFPDFRLIERGRGGKGLRVVLKIDIIHTRNT